MEVTSGLNIWKEEDAVKEEGRVAVVIGSVRVGKGNKVLVEERVNVFCSLYVKKTVERSKGM